MNYNNLELRLMKQLVSEYIDSYEGQDSNDNWTYQDNAHIIQKSLRTAYGLLRKLGREELAN